MKKVLSSLLLALVCLPMAIGQSTAASPIKTIEETSCGSFTWINGQTYTTDTVAAYTVGDTIYVLQLTITEGVVDTARAHKLTGRCSATFRGQVYEESGVIIDTIPFGNGCDSIVKLDIRLADPLYDTTYSVKACDYYVLPWKNAENKHDTIKTIGSRVVSNLDTVGGCIYTTTINLTVNRSDTNRALAVVEDVTGGCYYKFGDSIITDSNRVHYRNVKSVLKQCDSTIAIRVVAYNHTQFDTLNYVSCDTSYKWNRTNVIYYEDVNVDTMYYDSVSRCSTTYTLNLTFETERHDTVVATACGGYTYRFVQKAPNGSNQAIQEATVTESGIVDHHTDGTLLFEKTNKGCKTYHVIDLTVMQPEQRVSDSIHVIDACYRSTNARERRFTFDGETFGPFSASLDHDSVIVHRERGGNANKYNEKKCYDTTMTLRVTIRQSTYLEKRVSACDSYVWTEFNPNKVYTESTGSAGVEEKIYDTIITAKDSVKIYNEDSSAFEWQITKYDTSRVAKLNVQGCDSVGKLYLTINKSPNVTIEGDWMLEPGKSTLLRAKSDQENMKYQWYKNGVAVSGNEGKADSLLVESDADATEGQNIDIMLVGRKDYSGNNTCYDSSWVTVTSAYVGIDEAEAVAVAVYPNPAARLLSVSSSETISRIVLYNALGQQVLESDEEASKVQLDLSALPAGVYTMRVATAAGETTRKLIVRK